ILFSFAVIVFVPGDVFKEVLEHEVRFIDYAKLAWLVTSAATVAGAIGAGLENEEAVRQVTYGYRQYVRSKKVQEEEKEKQEKKQMINLSSNFLLVYIKYVRLVGMQK